MDTLYRSENGLTVDMNLEQLFLHISEREYTEPNIDDTFHSMVQVYAMAGANGVTVYNKFCLRDVDDDTTAGDNFIVDWLARYDFAFKIVYREDPAYPKKDLKWMRGATCGMSVRSAQIPKWSMLAPGKRIAHAGLLALCELSREIAMLHNNQHLGRTKN